MNPLIKRYGRDIRILCGGEPWLLYRIAKELGKKASEVRYVWKSLGCPSSIPNKEVLLLKPHKKPRAIPVTIEGLGTFPSVNAAARALECSRATLQSKIARHGTTLTVEQASVDLEQQERLRAVRRTAKAERKREALRGTNQYGYVAPSIEWLSFTDRPRGL